MKPSFRFLFFLSCLISTFNCIAQDDRGCNLTVVVDSIHASAPQAQDGSVNAIATGGAVPYTYRWYTGETSQSRSNLGTGYYCVTVTDANGCTGSDCSRVSAPGCESMGIGIGMKGLGASSDSNTVYTWADGGTTPYNYAWSNGATTDTVYDVPDGSYCVTITDANTCSMTACVANVSTVGIEEVSLGQVNIYPNPAQNILTVDVPEIETGTLTIVSLEGKVLLTGVLTQGRNTISTEGLANGMHIGMITNSSVTTYRKIFIDK